MCDIQLKKKLGSGAYSDVYKVKYHDDKDINLALKLYKKKAFRESFPEIDISMKINCDSLISGDDLITKSPECKKIFGNSQVGLIMKRISGNIQDFFKNIIITENLKILIIYKLLIQICQALECLKCAGYYHYDIKPENIFYEYSLPSIERIENLKKLHFYLGDYGICIPLDDFTDDKLRITDVRVVGTYIYLAPEMFKNKKVYSYYSSSSWMLALTLIEVMSGYNYYENVFLSCDSNDFDLAFKNLKNDFFPIVNKYIDEVFKDFFLRENKYTDKLKKIIKFMCLKDPLKRFSPKKVLEEILQNEKFNIFTNDLCEIFHFDIDINKISDTKLKKIFLDLNFRISEYRIKPSIKVVCQTLMHLLYLSSVRDDKNFMRDIDLSLSLNSNFYSEEDELTFSDLEYAEFIKRLDNIIFDNPIYMFSFTSEKIISELKLIISNPAEFRKRFKAKFEDDNQTKKDKDKNIIFEPSRIFKELKLN